MSDKRRGAHALWRAVFGEPPSLDAEPELLFDLLVRYLPRAPPYGSGASIPDDEETPPGA
jgi:hypothetical protein